MQSVGTKQLTEDGYVFSTNPTRIYNVLVLSDGSGSTVALKNANTTQYDSVVGTASVVTRVNYTGGLLFPGGCYVNLDDDHTTSVTVSYEAE